MGQHAIVKPNKPRWSWRRRLVAAGGALYLALLLASTVSRILQGDPPAPTGRESEPIQAYRADGSQSDPVDVAWIDSGPRNDRPPVVLLHGSPGSASDFTALSRALNETRRTIAIDMPGFGASEHNVPDYSVRTHALYVAEVADRLGIEDFHVLGFSMGGGVALHLAEDLGSRVLSVSMVSAIGVQEFELLGNYTLNHFIHGAQLLCISGFRNLFPHFGVLDDFPLDKSYARNFYDTDQRPLRKILETLEQPMLIVHGANDPLVPGDAALEHERLVPQSDLKMLAASHFFIFRADERLIQPLQAFLLKADGGEAARRVQATVERTARAALPFDSSIIPPWTGPALLVMLLVLALSTFISEDLTCIAAGLMVAQGRLAFIPAAAACYVGIVFGDMLLFWAGRALGRPAMRRAPFKWWVSDEAIAESSQWLQRRGGIVVLLSRFLPGARLPTNLAAGVLRTHALRFFGYFALAGMVWTPPFVWLSARVGDRLLPQLSNFRNGILVALVTLTALMWLVRHLLLPLLTWRGRRRLAGRWGRLRKWEFWPWWAIYPPVVVHILWLGLRHRSPTLFTAVNPAMPGGGIVGESKSDILDSLGAAPELPRWKRLSSGDLESRAAEVRAFLAHHSLALPIVLKPDAGERGAGVAIVHEDEDIETFLLSTPSPALVQEYAPGLEFGVFYVRGPEDSQGRIISINRKEMPAVVGDGTSTLEQLILNDPRAVRIQDIYLRENEGSEQRIPEAGKSVRLTEVGAHSRGTIFLDANEHATPELTQALDTVYAHASGIDFGRFDLRVPSIEALRSGTDFKILELNGVTSEAAHMYDPKYRLRDAQRILKDQWSQAFEVGAQRRRAGQQPIGIWGLLKLLYASRKPGGS